MKTIGAGEPFLVSYWYPSDVPSNDAAPIQIFNTCRAVAERGVAVTVHTRRLLSPSVEDRLAFCEISPHPNMRVVSTPSPWLGHRLLALRLERALAATSARRHMLVSRGEHGLERFAWAGGRRSPGQRNVYEAHRLCYTDAASGPVTEGQSVKLRDTDVVVGRPDDCRAVKERFERRATRTWAWRRRPWRGLMASSVSR